MGSKKRKELTNNEDKCVKNGGEHGQKTLAWLDDGEDGGLKEHAVAPEGGTIPENVFKAGKPCVRLVSSVGSR